MNRKLVAVITAITLVQGLTASHSANFQSYTLAINNNSGGLLDVKKTRGLSGVSAKTDIEDGQTVKAMVKRRGSKIEVVAGPENSKTLRVVEIFNKMPGAHAPSVTFTETGIVTNGFSTQDKVYRVTIHNRSGGFARILNATDSTGKGALIAPLNSTVITVKPNASIVVEMGPEKRKLTYKIDFADQTGKNPNITLAKRSFTSNGINAMDVQVQARRTSAITSRPRLAAEVTRKNLDIVKKTNRSSTSKALLSSNINPNASMNKSSARFGRRAE